MRRIDAERLDCVVYKGIPDGYEDKFDDGVMWILDQIDNLPTVEPEIVRCKDCQQYVYGSDEGCFYCRITGIGEPEDFFCGDAERRTDATEENT